jgi:hypothetical protein
MLFEKARVHNRYSISQNFPHSIHSLPALLSDALRSFLVWAIRQHEHEKTRSPFRS